VWAEVKCDMEKKNKTFTKAEVEKLMNENINSVTQEMWVSCTKHAENLQEEGYSK
jgi:hypothetical protein